jgi:hypothetical protein
MLKRIRPYGQVGTAIALELGDYNFQSALAECSFDNGLEFRTVITVYGGERFF